MPWLLFFVPHVALALVIAWTDTLGWDLAVRLALGISAVLPWWCCHFGRLWSVARAFALGPGLVALASAGLVVAVWLTSEGPNDWTLALALAMFTIVFVVYAVLVFGRRRVAIQ